MDALEFRVYRVNDPVKFMENLRELHSFGAGAGLFDSEQIDETHLAGEVSRLEGRAYGGHSRLLPATSFRTRRGGAARSPERDRQRSSRIVSEAEFAQIPILNQSQLVSRWRQLVPATYISDANDLAVPKLNAGLYLLEATDGRYKAYTLLMVTEMALVTRTTSGNVHGLRGRPRDAASRLRGRRWMRALGRSYPPAAHDGCEWSRAAAGVGRTSRSPITSGWWRARATSLPLRRREAGR